MTQGHQKWLYCYRSQGYGHRQSKCLTKVSLCKDQKSSTPFSQSNQKKTHAIVAKSHEDIEEAFTCVNVKKTDQVESRIRVVWTEKPATTTRYTVLLAMSRVMMVRSTLEKAS